jgi:hypothetical protein
MKNLASVISENLIGQDMANILGETNEASFLFHILGGKDRFEVTLIIDVIIKFKYHDDAGVRNLTSQ